MDLPEKEYLTVTDLSDPVIIKTKGSRFIAQVFHVTDATHAENIVQTVKKKYHDATHNCYAYRIDRRIFRYSDDGEPSGTAGKPIYQNIEGRNLYQTLVVVTRYFGGIKLGTGGLIHTYNEAATAGLEATYVKRVTRTITTDLVISYDKINQIENLIRKCHGTVIFSEYREVIHLRISIPGMLFPEFQKAVAPLVQMKEDQSRA
jgi:uncharacterized YigZ family protein